MSVLHLTCERQKTYSAGIFVFTGPRLEAYKKGGATTIAIVRRDRWHDATEGSITKAGFNNNGRKRAVGDGGGLVHVYADGRRLRAGKRVRLELDGERASLLLDGWDQLAHFDGEQWTVAGPEGATAVAQVILGGHDALDLFVSRWQPRPAPAPRQRLSPLGA